MGERKSHIKSRLGCIQCKARRVKCDERRPTCSNCRRRHETCSYQNPSDTAASSPDPNTNPNGLDHARAPTRSSTSPRRLHLRQLELIHIYSTDTHATTSVRPMDPAVQLQLVRLALVPDSSFLLDAIFTITSLHLAWQRPDESAERVADAVHYHSLAVANARLHLNHLDASLCRSMFHCSALFGTIALAFRAVDDAAAAIPPTDTLLELSKLWRGTGLIFYASRDLVDPETFALLFTPSKLIPTGVIDPEVDQILDILVVRAKEDKQAKEVAPPDSVILSTEEHPGTACYVSIITLRILFKACDQEGWRTLAWITESPPIFWELVGARDHLACAIVLTWSLTTSVLKEYWWAAPLQRQVMAELTPIVAADSKFAKIVEVVRAKVERSPVL